MKLKKYFRNDFALILIAAVIFAALIAQNALSGDPADFVGETQKVKTTDSPLLVGAARIDITPVKSLVMGGYGVCAFSKALCRWSKGVHDPIYATAVYFEKGDEAFVLIVADLVGLVQMDIIKIQDLVSQKTGLAFDHVIVAATHTHSSPDTVGLWGTILPPDTGRDAGYMGMIIAKAAVAASEAKDGARPAKLFYAVGEQADLHRNTYDDKTNYYYIDHTLTVLKAVDENGKTVATLTNWGCHPTAEGMKTRLISSDWVGAFYADMAEHEDGVHMFVNGSIGAAIQPSDNWRRKNLEGDGENFRWATLLGETLSKQVQGMLKEMQPAEVQKMVVQSTEESIPMMNGLYRFGRNIGVLKLPVPKVGDPLNFRIASVTMGPVRFGTMPGEISPQIGVGIRERLGGKAQVLVGLGQDWFGYVLDREQYENELYAYEKMLCAGPDFAEAIYRAYDGMTFPK